MTRLLAWVVGLAVALSSPGHEPRTHLDILPLPWAPVFVTETVTLTAYSSEVAQTDDTPFTTANGTRTRKGVIALSRDLLSKYPYGTKARLVSHACGLSVDYSLVVEDTMHPRKRRQVDLWMPDRKTALQWGRCKGTIVFYMED